MTLHSIHTMEHDAAIKYAVWIKIKKNKTTENMKIYFPIDLSKNSTWTHSRIANVGTGKILEANTWKQENAENDVVVGSLYFILRTLQRASVAFIIQKHCFQIFSGNIKDQPSLWDGFQLAKGLNSLLYACHGSAVGEIQITGREAI